MKKILIVLGIILILLLGAVWTYIFLYGQPKSVDEVFARFKRSPEIGTPIGKEPDTTIDVGSDEDQNAGEKVRLRQLTTRPVAGAVFIDGGVRYVEQGTGHVYEISLDGGEEKLVSGTTLKRTVMATFAPAGDLLTLTSENDGGSRSTVLGTLSQGSGDGGLELTALPSGAREVAFTPRGDALDFFIPNAEGGTAYSYTIATKKTTALFTIPLSDVHVSWGTPTYVYTTPSAYALGYVYTLGKNGLEYVTAGGSGLTAFHYASGTLVSTVTDGTLRTREVGSGDVPVLTMIPEKCTAQIAQPHIVYCGSPRAIPEGAVMPDDWYKGVAVLSDMLLRYDSTDSSVKVVSIFEEESGRPLDVLRIGTNAQGNLVYFINKYDNTLWMYDLR